MECVFLTRVDVQTRACRTVTPSGNILHLAHIVHVCHFLIAADIIVPLSRVHVFHPDKLLIRCATHWIMRWDIFTQTVTYIFTTVCIGHRTSDMRSVCMHRGQLRWCIFVKILLVCVSHLSSVMVASFSLPRCIWFVWSTFFISYVVWTTTPAHTAPHFVTFNHPLPLVGSKRFRPWFPFYLVGACMLRIFVVFLSFIVLSIKS